MKQALMISSFNNEARASCCLRKQETSPMIHVFSIIHNSRHGKY